MSKAFTSLKNLSRAHRKVEAFVKRVSAKPLAAHDPLLRGRPQATDNAGRTTFLTLPVERAIKLLQAVPKISNQRNEEARLSKAVHLEEVDLPQSMYSLAYVEEEDCLYLIDGNTRKLRLFSRRLADLLSELHFVTHYYATKAEALRAYHTYDSKQARKSGRNDIEGTFRQNGFAPEEFNSPSLQNGAVVTVVKNLARACYGSAGEVNQRRIIEAYGRFFAMLDPVGLEERNPPAGAVLASVLLLEMPAKAGVESYVLEYLKGVKSVYTRRRTNETPSAFFADLRADADRVCYAKGYGLSGEAACKLMAPVFVRGFLAYLMAATNRDKKRSLVNRGLSAEIFRLDRMLREELADKVKDKSAKAA